jgi:hypothetical protein
VLSGRPATSMGHGKDGHTRFWIRSRDSLGNAINQRLIEAAHRVWDRARLTVIRYLSEDTEAPEILEAVVDSASCAMNGRESIQRLEAYLLKSVRRESVRRLRRNRRIVYLDSSDLEGLAGSRTADLDRQLDDAKRIERLRACMDEQGRTMYDLRRLEYDWRSIARLTGYLDAHSAEVQFRKKLNKALDRFKAYRVSRPNPVVPRNEL